MGSPNKGAYFVILDGKVDALAKELNKAKGKFTEVDNGIKRTHADIDGLTKAVTNLAKAQAETRRDMQKLADANQQISNFQKGIMRAATSMFTLSRGISLVQSGIENNVNTAKEFEKTMSNMAALTGRKLYGGTAQGADEMKKYADAAIALGATTPYTAREVANTMKQLSLLLPMYNKDSMAVKELTKNSEILAVAGLMSVEDASKALAMALNKTATPLHQTSNLINIMAEAQRKGTGDINYITDAMERCGGVITQLQRTYRNGVTSSNSYAKAMANNGEVWKRENQDIADMIALFEAVAPVISSGAEAGTKFRSIFVNLSKQTNGDFNPAIVGMAKALANLKAHFDSIQDPQQRSLEMFKLFGKYNIEVANAMLESVPKFEEFRQEINGTNAAFEQNETNMNNFAGSVTMLKSAWEGLNLTFNSNNSIFRELVDLSTEFLTNLTRIIRVGQKFGVRSAITNPWKTNDYGSDTQALLSQIESDIREKAYNMAVEQLDVTTGEVVDVSKINDAIREHIQKIIDEYQSKRTGLSDNGFRNYMVKFQNGVNDLFSLFWQNDFRKSALKLASLESSIPIELDAMYRSIVNSLDKMINNYDNIIDTAIADAKKTPRPDAGGTEDPDGDDDTPTKRIAKAKEKYANEIANAEIAEKNGWINALELAKLRKQATDTLKRAIEADANVAEGSQVLKDEYKKLAADSEKYDNIIKSMQKEESRLNNLADAEDKYLETKEKLTLWLRKGIINIQEFNEQSLAAAKEMYNAYKNYSDLDRLTNIQEMGLKNVNNEIDLFSSAIADMNKMLKDRKKALNSMLKNIESKGYVSLDSETGSVTRNDTLPDSINRTNSKEFIELYKTIRDSFAKAVSSAEQYMRKGGAKGNDFSSMLSDYRSKSQNYGPDPTQPWNAGTPKLMSKEEAKKKNPTTFNEESYDLDMQFEVQVEALREAAGILIEAESGMDEATKKYLRGLKQDKGVSIANTAKSVLSSSVSITNAWDNWYDKIHASNSVWKRTLVYLQAIEQTIDSMNSAYKAVKATIEAINKLNNAKGWIKDRQPKESVTNDAYGASNAASGVVQAADPSAAIEASKEIAKAKEGEAAAIGVLSAAEQSEAAVNATTSAQKIANEAAVTAQKVTGSEEAAVAKATELGLTTALASAESAEGSISESVDAAKVAGAAAVTSANISEAASEGVLASAEGAEAVAGATKSGASLPFPYNLIAIAAGVAAVIAALASMGSFAQGGIAGGSGVFKGSSAVGDHGFARVNAGEMILDKQSQTRLYNALNGDGTIGHNKQALKGDVRFIIDGDKLVGVLENNKRRRGHV